jgi:hypothetical protein
VIAHCGLRKLKAMVVVAGLVVVVVVVVTAVVREFVVK